MSSIHIVSLEDARRAFREEAALLTESLNKKQDSSSQSEKFYLSSADVQRELGISKATLARWRKDKTIRFSPIGGKLFYLRSDVDKLIREHLVVADEGVAQ